MLSDPKLDCYDPEVEKQMAVQEHNMMTDELIDLSALWFMYGTQYADEVKVPILYALANMIGCGMGIRSMRKTSWCIFRTAREPKKGLLLAGRTPRSGGAAVKDGLRAALVEEVRSALA